MKHIALIALALTTLQLSPVHAANYDDMPYVKDCIALVDKQIVSVRDAVLLLSAVKDRASADAAAAGMARYHELNRSFEEEYLGLGKPSSLEFEALEAYEGTATLEEEMNKLFAQVKRIKAVKPSCYGSKKLRKQLKNM